MLGGDGLDVAGAQARRRGGGRRLRDDLRGGRGLRRRARARARRPAASARCPPAGGRRGRGRSWRPCRPRTRRRRPRARRACRPSARRRRPGARVRRRTRTVPRPARRPSPARAAAALGDGGDPDGGAEDHLVVLGHAVVDGHGPGREVVGGGDPPRASRPAARRAPTSADAGDAASEQRTNAAQGIRTQSRRRLTAILRGRVAATPITARLPAGHGGAHGYDASQGRFRAHGPRGRQAVGPEVALVRAQQPALEPRPHPRRVRPPARVLPLAAARQRAGDAARGPAGARASTCCSSRTCGSRRRRPGRIRIGAGSFLNLGVQVAAVELVDIGAHCMLANGCFVTDGSHRFDDPDRPVPWQGFTTKGPTRIGDNVWCGANVVVTSGVTIGRRCVIGANSVVTRDLPPFSDRRGLARARVLTPDRVPLAGSCRASSPRTPSERRRRRRRAARARPATPKPSAAPLRPARLLAAGPRRREDHEREDGGHERARPANEVHTTRRSVPQWTAPISPPPSGSGRP